MPGRKKFHSDQWWASGAKPGVRRCKVMKPSGSQCRREAEPGAVVCGQHGGLAPQVQARARERLAIASDAIVEQLLSWLYDDTIAVALKVKIAQDVLDRAGVDRSTKVTVGVDPVQALFHDLLERPDALEDEPVLALPAPAYDGPVVHDDGSISGSIIEENPWDDADDVHDAVNAVVIDAEATPPSHLAEDIRAGRYVP